MSSQQETKESSNQFGLHPLQNNFHNLKGQTFHNLDYFDNLPNPLENEDESSEELNFNGISNVCENQSSSEYRYNN